MAGPPDDLTPSAAWLALSQQPRPHAVIDFPRYKDGKAVTQVGMWVLSQEEQTAAQATAEATTRKLLRDVGKEIPRNEEARQGYDDIYNNEGAVEVLFRACRDPVDVKRPFFPSTAAVRSLSVDEVAVLFHHYLHTQASLGPIVSHMSESEYVGWAELLAKGAGVFPLGVLSLQAKNDLIVRLAKDAWSFLTGSSSSGSAPSDGKSDNPSEPAEPVKTEGATE